MIRKWLRKLFCFHVWAADPWPPNIYMAWFEREWQCVKCEKKIVKRNNWLPINPVT